MTTPPHNPPEPEHAHDGAELTESEKRLVKALGARFGADPLDDERWASLDARITGEANTRIVPSTPDQGILRRARWRPVVAAILLIGIPTLLVGIPAAQVLTRSWRADPGLPSQIARPAPSIDGAVLNELQARIVATDIRDAYILQLAINSGQANRSSDVTGDGVVNRADVDALALQAVALPAAHDEEAG